ncbi:hypothetical protein CEP52_006301 [Fusarium oligoseptatum]|uniref:Uncharacterized protein n=1 Tax=Fusarium oligoseptatum TaxID=2604345 RepID=A0A428TTH3_9HYPO|nr:hypothetical protein CEP52_006301 [Fusarium oligoseptatum]
MPARSGIDTEQKLRLISSAAALGNLFGPVGNTFQGFETNANVFRRGHSPGVTVMGPAGGDVIVHDIHSVADLPSQRSSVKARDAWGQEVRDDGRSSGIGISTSKADHDRAVPLSDGSHILFTDPKTGYLCLGTDAPAGSLNRLIRKVWFRPPANASSPLPVLYAAGADIRHGVRVVATFSVNGGDGMQLDSDEVATGCGSGPQKVMDMDADKQMIVFYTIPPDLFLAMSQGSYGDIDFTGDPSSEATAKAYPLEIRGQAVAICSNLVELALDSGPDMVLWAFSAQGWARAWALHAGREDAFNHTVVQQDGSLRQVDREGDYAMAQVDQTSTTSGVDGKGLDGGHVSTGTTFGWNQPGVERDRSMKSGEQGDGMDGTVSVELVEEVNGIARIEVELR